LLSNRYQSTNKAALYRRFRSFNEINEINTVNAVNEINEINAVNAVNTVATILHSIEGRTFSEIQPVVDFEFYRTKQRRVTQCSQHPQSSQ